MKLLTIALAFFALVGTARADGLVFQASEHWACSPVGALSAYQLNLKTGEFQQGVALGAGYGCRFTGWAVPLGLNVLGGASVNTNATNSAQGHIMLTVADNYGLAIGAQAHKDPVDGHIVAQGLLSVMLGASWAATLDQLRASALSGKACAVPTP